MKYLQLNSFVRPAEIHALAERDDGLRWLWNEWERGAWTWEQMLAKMAVYCFAVARANGAFADREEQKVDPRKWDSILSHQLDGKQAAFTDSYGTVHDLIGGELVTCENQRGGCRITGTLKSKHGLPLESGTVRFGASGLNLAMPVKIVSSLLAATGLYHSGVNWHKDRATPPAKADAEYHLGLGALFVSHFGSEYILEGGTLSLQKAEGGEHLVGGKLLCLEAIPQGKGCVHFESDGHPVIVPVTVDSATYECDRKVFTSRALPPGGNKEPAAELERVDLRRAGAVINGLTGGPSQPVLYGDITLSRNSPGEEWRIEGNVTTAHRPQQVSVLSWRQEGRGRSHRVIASHELTLPSGNVVSRLSWPLPEQVEKVEEVRPTGLFKKGP